MYGAMKKRPPKAECRLNIDDESNGHHKRYVTRCSAADGSLTCIQTHDRHRLKYVVDIGRSNRSHKSVCVVRIDDDASDDVSRNYIFIKSRVGYSSAFATIVKIGPPANVCI